MHNDSIYSQINEKFDGVKIRKKKQETSYALQSGKCPQAYFTKGDFPCRELIKPLIGGKSSTKYGTGIFSK